jgi:hypothetical protein
MARSLGLAVAVKLPEPRFKSATRDSALGWLADHRGGRRHAQPTRCEPR